MASKDSTNKGIRVLILGAVLLLFLGIIYVWSVFVKPVSDYFNWDISGVKLTSSFMLSFFVLGILISGKFERSMGTAKITLIGGIMMAFGMAATSFVPKSTAWLIYITYGVIGGFGVGMGYNAVISCAQKWFPQKRGLATGISVCAFGFSTVIFAPLTEELVTVFDVITTFRILAAAFCAITLILFSFIKLPDESMSSQTTTSKSTDKRQFTPTEMLRTKEFYFITISLMLGTIAYFVLNPSFKTLAMDRGISATASTGIVMMTGIANSLGRLSIPLASDKAGREITGIVILLATGVCSFLLCFVTGFGYMAAVAVISFSYGGLSGIYPLFTSDNFGIKNVGSNYGTVMCGFAISALFAPILLNLVESIFVKFLIVAALAVIAMLMVVILYITKKKQKKNKI